MAAVIGDTNATLKDLTMVVDRIIEGEADRIHPLICTTLPEEGAYTKIPVSANMPMPRLFEAERSSQGKDVTVVQNYNQATYELTIDLDSDLVRNAKAYNQADLLEEAVESATLFPDYLASQAVLAGTSNTAYDGVAFYGTTHKYANAGSNAINNIVSATGTTVTALYADMQTAVARMKTFKDNQGRLLNPQIGMGAKNLVVHCPAALELPFRQLVTASMVPIAVPVTTSGTAAAPVQGNILGGVAEILGDGYFDGTSASAWYLHYVAKKARPFVFIQNYGLQATVLGFGSEHETNTNKIRIALKRRFVLGYYRFDRSVRVA